MLNDVNKKKINLWNFYPTYIAYEKLMYKYEFHSVMILMDAYIRNINKTWVKNMKLADETQDKVLHAQVLVDAFHMVRIATVLMHPIAPEGTEMILEYLNFKEEFWDWNRIFQTIFDFMNSPEEHVLKFLEPRVDFFKKHESQIVNIDN